MQVPVVSDNGGARGFLLFSYDIHFFPKWKYKVVSSVIGNCGFDCWASQEGESSYRQAVDTIAGVGFNGIFVQLVFDND